MTQRQTQAKTLLTALENYYPSYFGSDRPISANFKIQNKVYPKRWVLEETFRLAEIPQDSSDIGVAIRKLEEIYASSETTTQMPEYKEQTSTVTPGLDEKIEYAKQREVDILKTRENAQREVERARARTETIIKEQQKIQDQIAKAKLVQPQIENLKVFASITIPEPPILTEQEQIDLNNLQDFSKSNKIELINDLANEIETKSINIKKEISTEQIKLFARNQAEVIVEKLQNTGVVSSELPEIIQLAILDTVTTDTTTIPVAVISKEGLESITHSSKILYNEASDILSTQEIAENILGKKFALKMFGPSIDDIKITFRQIQTENSVPIDLGQINKDATQVQERQNLIISEAKNITVSEARGYLYSNTSSFIESKIAALPVDSKIRSIYSNPAVRGILSKYGLANSIEWQAYTKFGTGVLKYFPESAPYWSAFSQITGIYTGINVASKIVPMSFGGGAIPLSKMVAIQPIKWAGVPFKYGVATGSKIAIGTGAKIAGQAAGKAAGTGLAATLSASFATALSWIPFAGQIIGAVTGWLFGKILEKVNWGKVKKFFGEYVLPVAVGGGIFLMGFPVAGLAAGGLLFGIGRGLTFAGLGAAFWGFLGVIGGSIGTAIATPVIITLLALPPLVALILLVINNSAYVVPPSSYSSLIGADNPYMLVTKTANPTKIPNSISGSVPVTYTIEIKALKDSLTNIKIVSTECNVIKKNKAKINCPVENIPDLPKDLSISPTAPYTFTFTSSYNSGYNDSLVYDSITVRADSVEQKGISTAGSASVCIGDCPTDCVKIADIAQKWPSSLRSNAESALGRLSSGHQGFMAKVCAKNEEINLCYNPSRITEGYFAWHIHNSDRNNCDVYFNQKGVGNSNDSLFLITHELTHHIQDINGASLVQYLVSGGYGELKGNGFCSYKDTAGSSTEAMAEANGLYASIPSWGKCVTNYKNQYPKNYIFAQNFMK